MSTRRGANGIVYQAGLGVDRRDALPKRLPLGNVYRAMVINTYSTEDTDKNKLKYQVLCDVILCKSMIPLRNVPVALEIGVNNACIPWIPKPTTATLSGKPLRFRPLDKQGRFEGDVTSFADMNGDLVRVQFVEGSSEFPIVVGRSTHRSTKRLVRNGDGWVNSTQDSQRGTPEKGEAYFRHNGLEVRANADGSLLVDTVGATTDERTETPSTSGGEARFRIKRGQELVVTAGSIAGQGNAGGKDLIAVKQEVDGSVVLRAADNKLTIAIDPLGGIVATLSGGFVYTKPPVGPAFLNLLGATQPMVLGTAYQTALSGLQTALGTYATALGAGVPTNPLTIGQAASAAGVLTTALAAFATAVTASLSLVLKGE